MPRRKPLYATIGSISSLDPTEDPIGDLAYELRSLLKRCSVDRERRKVCVALLRTTASMGDEDTPRASNWQDDCLHALSEALETFAPPHATFDKQVGEFGFWPIVDDDEVPHLKDNGSEHRDYWGAGDVMLVNDHGNVSCGRFSTQGRWIEYWACV